MKNFELKNLFWDFKRFVRPGGKHTNYVSLEGPKIRLVSQ